MVFSQLLAGRGLGQAFIAQREVVNYDKQEYGAGAQNWKIRQDSVGRMYFANNEGVLVFDGTYWALFPLPNKTIVRSIEFGPDGRLYAGGQDEIGYFAPDANGTLTYTSLLNLLPPSEQRFSDVWDVVRYHDEIFFRSNYKILRYTRGSITIHPPISTWLFLGRMQDRLIAHDEQTGIMVYSGGRWETMLPRNQLPEGLFITSICPYSGDTSLVTTAGNGLFLLTPNALVPFGRNAGQQDQLPSYTGAERLNDGHFIITTYNEGLYRIDDQGRISERYSKKEGLQNSIIRSVFVDRNQSIWLGLDNGISLVAFSQAIKHINPTVFNDGAGYSVAEFSRHLYFALSNGIYAVAMGTDNGDLSGTPNDLIRIAGGQSWNLSVVGNRLLAGRDDGLFAVDRNQLVPESNETGYWTSTLFTQPGGVATIAAGNYDGITIFQQDKVGAPGEIIFRENLGSARFLVIARQTIWVSHPYRGVYRIKPGDPKNGRVRQYTASDGLPSTLNNHIFSLRGSMVVATERGIYEYDESADRFRPVAAYSKIFGQTSVRYLREDKEGNIWFVHEKTPGVVDYSSGKPQLIYLPELTGRILSGFENIYPVNEENVFIGGETGFYHVNFSKYKKNIHAFQTYIRSVSIISRKDSVIFGGYGPGPGKSDGTIMMPRLPHDENELHFAYSSSLFEQHANIEYSYFLKGFDDNWSEWSPRTEKDYTGLPAGNYSFRVKARNNLNNETIVSSYSFRILPPWYQTNTARAVYVALILLAGFLGYKWQERRHLKQQEQKIRRERLKHEEEQKQLMYQHQLELEQSEKDLIRLQNEKLESEITHKNAELASAAMNLVQKKEFMLKVRNGLQQLVKSGADKTVATDLRKLLRILSEEENLDQEWQQFSIHFDKVHGNFLRLLKEHYPDLKPHELKLCAYLRMNLSSKEIAQLMSISVRGVEISRYRLRKKLEIPTEVNLFQFLFDFHSSNSDKEDG